jgi:hypothetical protein
MLAECEYESRWNNYLFDCVWSQAVNRNFVEYTGKVPQQADEYPTRPTLPRWHELIEPKEEVTAVDAKENILTGRLFAAAGIG